LAIEGGIRELKSEAMGDRSGWMGMYGPWSGEEMMCCRWSWCVEGEMRSSKVCSVGCLAAGVVDEDVVEEEEEEEEEEGGSRGATSKGEGAGSVMRR
jgi:hypothetical protein